MKDVLSRLSACLVVASAIASCTGAQDADGFFLPWFASDDQVGNQSPPEQDASIVVRVPSSPQSPPDAQAQGDAPSQQDVVVDVNVIDASDVADEDARTSNGDASDDVATDAVADSPAEAEGSGTCTFQIPPERSGLSAPVDVITSKVDGGLVTVQFVEHWPLGDVTLSGTGDILSGDVTACVDQPCSMKYVASCVTSLNVIDACFWGIGPSTVSACPCH